MFFSSVVHYVKLWLLGLVFFSTVSLCFAEELGTTSASGIANNELVVVNVPPHRSRGEYLVEIAQCGACHGREVANPRSSLSGGFQIRDEFGFVHVPNITPSKGSGIGNWKKEEIASAIRSSIGKDSQKLSISSHQGYRWMSDQDVHDIVDYLLSLEPVDSNDHNQRVLSGLSTKSWGLIEKHSEIRGYVPAPVISTSGYYGMYLVDNVMQCSRCHSQDSRTPDDKDYLGGGELDWYSLSGKEIKMPNIKYQEEGIGGWKDQDFQTFIRHGIKKDGTKILSDCPQSYFSSLTEADMKAVTNYLKSLK